MTVYYAGGKITREQFRILKGVRGLVAHSGEKAMRLLREFSCI